MLKLLLVLNSFILKTIKPDHYTPALYHKISLINSINSILIIEYLISVIDKGLK